MAQLLERLASERFSDGKLQSRVGGGGGALVKLQRDAPYILRPDGTEPAAQTESWPVTA